MNSDVLEPKQLQIQFTLAEENLLEQLDNLFSKIVSIVNEVGMMFNDVFQSRLEVLRTRIIRTLGFYRDLRDSYRGILEYASRVAPALVTGNNYLNILNISSEIIEKIHNLCIHFAILQSTSQLNENIVISAQKTLNLLIDNITRLRNVLRAYIEMPMKSDEVLGDLLKAAQNLSVYYDEFYTNLAKESIEATVIIIMDDINDVINSFTRICEALLCLHMVKRR